MKQKKFEQYKRIFRFFEILISVAVQAGLFAFAWYTRINPLAPKPFTGKGNYLEIAVYIVVMFIFFRNFDGFEIGFFTPLNVALSQILALLCGNMLMWIIIVLTIGSIYPVFKILLIMLILTVIQTILAIIVVNLLDKMHIAIFPAWDMLLIYENDSVRLFTDKVESRKDKYIIGEKIHVSEGFEVIKKKISEHDSVIIYDVSSNMRNDIVKYCYGEDKRIYQTPKISDILIRGAGENHLFDTPLLSSGNIGLTFEQKLVKRLCDIVLALLMIIITSPVMLITAIAIKLEDHGPVMFIQERVTYKEKVFKIYKFRSMIVDAEKDGKPRPAIANDDRITKVGKFIRKTRIDELPQLFNILLGDMSIVGPRPERCEHVEKYTKEIPEFKYRTKVKGGLTGYAQVYGKYNTSAYDKLKLDLMYIENYSFALDLRIIILTIKVIFMKSSTEGFEEAKSKAMTQANREEEK